MNEFVNRLLSFHLQRENGDVLLKKGDFVIYSEHVIELVAKTALVYQNLLHHLPPVHIEAQYVVCWQIMIFMIFSFFDNLLVDSELQVSNKIEGWEIAWIQQTACMKPPKIQLNSSIANPPILYALPLCIDVLLEHRPQHRPIA